MYHVHYFSRMITVSSVNSVIHQRKGTGMGGRFGILAFYLTECIRRQSYKEWEKFCVRNMYH